MVSEARLPTMRCTFMLSLLTHTNCLQRNSSHRSFSCTTVNCSDSLPHARVQTICPFMSREAGQQLLDFIERQCSAQSALPLLIAHNGRGFDIPFLHNELQRNGLALPEQTLFFDTYPYSRQILPPLGRLPVNYKQVCHCPAHPLGILVLRGLY